VDGQGALFFAGTKTGFNRRRRVTQKLSDVLTTGFRRVDHDARRPKFMKKALFPLATVGLLALAPTSFAALEDFTVTLNGAQETPVNNSTASGLGTLTFDTTANTLTLNNITYSGLSANSTAAHIHGPGAPGVGVGVLYGMSPTYTTLGSTSGSFSGTLTLTAGTGNFSIPEQVSQLEGGLWYLNVHNANFPGGEIRGQILPVPEPSTLALSGLGVGLLAWLPRRRD